MAKIRASLFFEFGKFGWSETYVQEAASVDAVGPAALALVNARKKLLAVNVELPYVRTSDADVFRDSRIQVVPSGSAKGAQLEKCTEPWSCVLARMESGTTYRKNIFLRGVPDAALDPDAGLNDLVAAYKDDVNKYLAYLKDNSWGFLVRVRFPLNGAAQIVYGTVINVDGITTAPKVVVKTANNHLLVNGDRVLIRGVKGPRGANGLHEVKTTGYGATEFELLGVEDNRIYLGGGSWRMYKVEVAVPDKVSFVRVAKRDTGRPSSSPRGRRLTRKP